MVSFDNPIKYTILNSEAGDNDTSYPLVRLDVENKDFAADNYIDSYGQITDLNLFLENLLGISHEDSLRLVSKLTLSNPDVSFRLDELMLLLDFDESETIDYDEIRRYLSNRDDQSSDISGYDLNDALDLVFTGDGYKIDNKSSFDAASLNIPAARALFKSLGMTQSEVEDHIRLLVTMTPSEIAGIFEDLDKGDTGNNNDRIDAREIQEFRNVFNSKSELSRRTSLSIARNQLDYIFKYDQNTPDYIKQDLYYNSRELRSLIENNYISEANFFREYGITLDDGETIIGIFNGDIDKDLIYKELGFVII
ncbi:MAG: hypothetical protein AAF621_04415 [Pseudomonadota bacterium]